MSRITCSGVSIFRLNRIKPHGRSTRMNSRSAALSSVPDTPVMNAREFMGPISPQAARGSRKRPLIPLDDALPAGSFQVAAELLGLVRCPERANHGAVIDALVAEIGALDDRRTRCQHGWVFALQGPIGGLRVGLVLLRGDLDQVSAAAARRCLYRIAGCGPGPFRGGERLGAPRRQGHRRLGR